MTLQKFQGVKDQFSTSEISFLSRPHLLSMIGFCLLWGKSSFMSHCANGSLGIPDCSCNKMMCPSISLGAMLQTLLNSQWKYRQFQWTLKLLILNASNLVATIQVSPKCTWLICNYLVKLLNSSIFRMIIYPYIQTSEH